MHYEAAIEAFTIAGNNDGIEQAQMALAELG
jgi:hypothetical protein